MCLNILSFLFESKHKNAMQKYTIFSFSLCFYLLFFSTKTTAQNIEHWESIVNNDVVWQYISPNVEPPSNWKDIGFSATGWQSGEGGIGYGDGDDNTIIEPTISVFMRTEFEIADLSIFEEIRLAADFDDALVAYLNGVEIVRINVSSNENNVPFDALANGENEANLVQNQLPDFFDIDLELLNEGTNVLAIQVHNHDISSSDLSSNMWLLAGVNTEDWQYDEPPVWFSYQPPTELTDSNLPIIVIETFGEINEFERIVAEMGIINNADGERNYITDEFNDYDGRIEIKYRGSSSLGFDKKNYSVETQTETGENNNVSIFGFPEENDWVLHGPFSDKSLMRNVLAYELGRRQGKYHPRTQFCELVIDGDYRGVYVFLEKIKRDNGRLDLSTLDENDVSDSDITGGYIIKIDRWDEPNEAWPSDYENVNGDYSINFVHVYPKHDEITAAQRDYIRNYINDFEDSMVGNSFLNENNGYKTYINLQSFADFFLVNELSMNVDAYRLSTYMHKHRNGKLRMGPLWDFNLSFGNADYCDGGYTTQWMYATPNCDGSPFWWRKMNEDPAFRNMARCRWEELRNSYWHTDSLMQFIDEQAALLEEAQTRNFEAFDILNTYVWPNFFIGANYDSEVLFLKNWLTNRLNFMDENLLGTAIDCPEETVPFVTSAETAILQNSSNATFSFEIYPNPTKNNLYIDSDCRDCQLVFYDFLGKKVKQIAFSPYLDIFFLKKGTYIVELKSETKGNAFQRFVKF